MVSIWQKLAKAGKSWQLPGIVARNVAALRKEFSEEDIAKVVGIENCEAMKNWIK